MVSLDETLENLEELLNLDFLTVSERVLELLLKKTEAKLSGSEDSGCYSLRNRLHSALHADLEKVRE